MSEVSVPLNRPSLGALEARYIGDALASGWITSGAYVARFEAGMAALSGKRFAVACSSGTAALWLALKALGVTGRVAVPSYTCDSLGNAAHLVTGTPPVILDVDADTWALDGGLLAQALANRLLNIGAVVFVHTYGVPGRDLALVADLCHRYAVPLVEDASEAHGARVNGQTVGRFGDMSVFSCRGEKAVSGAQLGAVCTDDERVMRKVRQLVNNGLPSGVLRYWSTDLGLNWQPSNLHCALATAQLERLDELLKARLRTHQGWREVFVPEVERGQVRFQGFAGALEDCVWWLTAVDLSGLTHLDPRDLGWALRDRGIETRPPFYPLETMPHNEGCEAGPCPVSARLFRSLLILPSGDGVGPDEQTWVRETILEVCGR